MTIFHLTALEHKALLRVKVKGIRRTRDPDWPGPDK